MKTNIKNPILSLLMLFFGAVLIVNGQTPSVPSKDTSTVQNNRKNKLFFSLGAAYRIGALFNFESNSEWLSRGVNHEDLNRGSALFYSLDYFITHDLSIGFSHALRYDHLHEGSVETLADGNTSTAVVADTYSLLFDYHFFLNYHFRMFKQQEFFVLAGISFLNIGPQIYKNPIQVVNQGRSYTDQTKLDLTDKAGKFGLGYQKERFSLMGGVYFSGENPFYNGAAYTLPFVEIKYQLGNLFR